MFNKRIPSKATGRPALISESCQRGEPKHMLNLDDRETIAQITENMYRAKPDRPIPVKSMDPQVHLCNQFLALRLPDIYENYRIERRFPVVGTVPEKILKYRSEKIQKPKAKMVGSPGLTVENIGG